MKGIYVIYGYQNSGKTHTAWLVYCMLSAIGKRDRFDTFEKDLTYDEVLDKINENIADLSATIKIGDIKVAIFSQGDILSYFRNDMGWAKCNDIDYVICCCRYINRSGSINRELHENYSNLIVSWYKKEFYTENQTNDRISDAEQIAQAIYNDLITRMEEQNKN